jgi:hypothetical protein
MNTLQTPTSPPVLHGTPLSPPVITVSLSSTILGGVEGGPMSLTVALPSTVSGIYTPLASPLPAPYIMVTDEKELPASSTGLVHVKTSSHMHFGSAASAANTALVVASSSPSPSPIPFDMKERPATSSALASSRVISVTGNSNGLLEKQRPSPISIPSNTGTISVPSTGGHFTALSPPLPSAVSMASTALITVPPTPFSLSPPPLTTATSMNGTMTAASIAAQQRAAALRRRQWSNDVDNDTYRDSYTAMVFKRAMILQSLRPEPLIGEAPDSPAQVLHMTRGVHSFAQLNSLSRIKVSSLYHDHNGDPLPMYLHEKKKQRDLRRAQRRPQTMESGHSNGTPTRISTTASVVAAARAATSYGVRSHSPPLPPNKRPPRGLVRTPSQISSSPPTAGAVPTTNTPPTPAGLRRLSSSSGTSSAGSPMAALSTLMTPTASSLAHAAPTTAIASPLLSRSSSLSRAVVTATIVDASPTSSITTPTFSNNNNQPSPTWGRSPPAALPPNAATRIGTLPLATPHSLSHLPRTSAPPPLQPHSFQQPSPSLSQSNNSVASPAQQSERASTATLRSSPHSGSLPQLHARPATTTMTKSDGTSSAPSSTSVITPVVVATVASAPPRAVDRSLSILPIEAGSNTSHNPLGLKLKANPSSLSSSSPSPSIVAASSTTGPNPSSAPPLNRVTTFSDPKPLGMAALVAATPPRGSGSGSGSDVLNMMSSSAHLPMPPIITSTAATIVEEDTPSMREYRLATNARFGHVLAVATQKAQVSITYR